MQKFTTLFFITWFLLCTMKAEEKQEKKLIVIEPSAFHLGKISDRKKVSRTFVITNHSKEKFDIISVSTGCGCTAAKPNPKTVLPGASSKLVITFNPKGRSGYSLWTINVYTNHLKMPHLKATFDVTILKDGIISKKFLSFGEFQRGVAAKNKVWIAPKGVSDFKVKKVTFESEKKNCFNITTQMGMYDGFYPGKRKAFLVKLVAKKDIPYGRIDGKLVIETNIPKYERIAIPILAKVAGKIGVSRYYVSMGLIKPGRKVKRVLRVYHREGKEFTITKVSSSLKFIQTQLKVVIPKQYYKVIVSMGKDTKLKNGEFRGKLTIETTDKNQSVIDIPLQGIYKK